MKIVVKTDEGVCYPNTELALQIRTDDEIQVAWTDEYATRYTIAPVQRIIAPETITLVTTISPGRNNSKSPPLNNGEPPLSNVALHLRASNTWEYIHDANAMKTLATLADNEKFEYKGEAYTAYFRIAHLWVDKDWFVWQIIADKL